MQNLILYQKVYDFLLYLYPIKPDTRGMKNSRSKANKTHGVTVYLCLGDSNWDNGVNAGCRAVNYNNDPS